MRTKSGNIFLLVITDRFPKQNQTLPIKHITATAVVHTFVQPCFLRITEDSSIRERNPIFAEIRHLNVPNHCHKKMST